jgi:glycosyltransferase involved in cell wall biosynthesis
MSGPTVSIIISSYNYARFLRESIESALGQHGPAVEVVVVDDGSTDGSREIIASFGNDVVPVLKANGGMASAWNAGLASSRGDLVIFLDADDMLLPSAAHRATELFTAGIVKVHWPVWITDEHGERTGRMVPAQELPEGDFRQMTIEQGPDAIVSPPIHGNAWSRRFLDRVFPIPETEFRRHSDTYLYTLAPLEGCMRRVAEPQACYRLHGSNDYACRSLEEKNRRNLAMFRIRSRILSEHLRASGVEIDPAVWERSNAYFAWMRALDAALLALKAVIPAGSTIIVVDQNEWSDGWQTDQLIASRRTLPFLERGGEYWGPPSDDSTAVRELDRMRAEGADFIVFAWPAFWWLQHYRGLHQHLRATYRCVLENDQVVVFDLAS